MKRRNPKKSDSFDFIKASPIKTTNYGSSIILREHQYKYRSPQINVALNGRYIQLPRPNPITSAKLKKKFLKQDSNQQSLIQNKLILLCNQEYQEHHQHQKHEHNKKINQEIKDFKKNKQFGYKKLYINNQTFIHKRIFIQSIISNMSIKQNCYHGNGGERKKFCVFVENGNNSRMVKEILRKRANVVFIMNKIQANFVWTRFCDYQISKYLSICYEEDHNQKTSFYDDRNQSTSIEHEMMYSLPRQSKSRQYYQQQIGSVRMLIKTIKIHNHLTNHHEISDKKSLFRNLERYCIKNKLKLFQMVPVTYQIKDYQNMELSKDITDGGFWFIKPGEDSNRGNGISIASGRGRIREEVINLLRNGKTALVQQYIDPLLYRNRKFDIRCYALVVCFRGELKVYWYKQGYIRTCSKQFTYQTSDIYAHLTNDAIQKKHPSYGKYQQSNKLSFGDLQIYLRTKEIYLKDLCQDMKKLVIHSIKSVEDRLLGERNQFNFQIFGYDFLIDKRGKIWLIEVNTNPCLQFTGSLTSRIIGHMIDNTFRIALDSFIIGQSSRFSMKEEFYRMSDQNKYQCIL